MILLRQNENALKEAQAEIRRHNAEAAPSPDSKAELDRLHQEIKGLRARLVSEQEKRQGCEVKESSAIKHQSALAKNVRDYEIKVVELEKKLQEEAKRRSTAEQLLAEVKWRQVTRLC